MPTPLVASCGAHRPAWPALLSCIGLGAERHRTPGRRQRSETCCTCAHDHVNSWSWHQGHWGLSAKRSVEHLRSPTSSGSPLQVTKQLRMSCRVPMRVRLPGAHLAHAQHPNQCSGHPSQCFTPKHHSLLQPRRPDRCGLRGPRVGGKATSPLPSRGPQHGVKKWGKGGPPGKIGGNFAWHTQRSNVLSTCWRRMGDNGGVGGGGWHLHIIIMARQVCGTPPVAGGFMCNVRQIVRRLAHKLEHAVHQQRTVCTVAVDQPVLIGAGDGH